jgi:hypothetical protein
MQVFRADLFLQCRLIRFCLAVVAGLIIFRSRIVIFRVDISLRLPSGLSWKRNQLRVCRRFVWRTLVGRIFFISFAVGWHLISVLLWSWLWLLRLCDFFIIRLDFFEGVAALRIFDVFECQFMLLLLISLSN